MFLFFYEAKDDKVIPFIEQNDPFASAFGGARSEQFDAFGSSKTVSRV